jgi:uncharacterized protein (DUF2236 family)
MKHLHIKLVSKIVSVECDCDRSNNFGGQSAFIIGCMDSIIRLPRFLARSLDAAAIDFLNAGGARRIDFSQPRGEPALLEPDSVSWRIFKNPVALWTGGIAAVILELAEPSIRAAIWDHSSFRRDPLGRLRRTGMAAMLTVYGPSSVSSAMIAGVVRMHGQIRGENSAGMRYSANDADLLKWVQTTAAFGFGEAFNRYVRPLKAGQFDQFYSEGVPVSMRYGVVDAPRSRQEVEHLFAQMLARLEPSESLFEFLRIMSHSDAFPRLLRPLQRLLVRAAVDLVPWAVRRRLGLTSAFGLSAWQRPAAGVAGALVDRIVLPRGPAAQACLRLGYPVSRLYDRSE